MELNISPNLTIEDIHKIREYNYEMTKNMNLDELNEYYQESAEKVLAKMENLKLEKELKAV
jgi:hypothetical protein